jgi:hypothetical protein
LLIGSASITIFFDEYCQESTISSLSLDYDPLPFTTADVVNVNDIYLSAQVAPPHRTDIGQQMKAILRYDSIRMRSAFAPNAHETFQTTRIHANISLVSSGIINLLLRSCLRFVKEESIVRNEKDDKGGVAKALGVCRCNTGQD